MKNIKEFINEDLSIKGLDKDTLYDLKKGDQAVIVMHRYNPQLGSYVTLSDTTVTKVTSTNVYCQLYDKDAIFHKNNRYQKNPSQAIYGSSFYELYTYKEAKKMLSNNNKEWYGYKVSSIDINVREYLKESKNWSDNVKTDWHPIEGLFTWAYPDKIAQYLIDNSEDEQQAMSRLNFYMNRAGDKLKYRNKVVLNKVKDILSSKK